MSPKLVVAECLGLARSSTSRDQSAQRDARGPHQHPYILPSHCVTDDVTPDWRTHQAVSLAGKLLIDIVVCEYYGAAVKVVTT